jgi:hypothetical protein
MSRPLGGAGTGHKSTSKKAHQVDPFLQKVHTIVILLLSSPRALLMAVCLFAECAVSPHGLPSAKGSEVKVIVRNMTMLVDIHTLFTTFFTTVFTADK